MIRSGFIRVVLASCLIIPAQFTGDMVAPVQAQTAAMPQFTPMGEWRVEATSLSQIRGLSGIKLPCMMAANYDNGYIVRISGGNNAMLAMAIDFRQNVFRQGRQYKAQLSINGGRAQAIKATAFAENVLIFNLRPLSNFYSELQSANHMTLDVEGNQFGFAMNGVGSAVQNLESCYSGTPAMGTTDPGQMGMQNASADPLDITPPAPWNDDAARGVPMTNKRNTNQGQPSGVMLWQARAGDDMQQTLESWANKAGVELAWQADQPAQIVDDIRVNGTFEDAVQTLMAQNATALGLEANIMQGGPNVRSASRLSGGQPVSLMADSTASANSLNAANVANRNMASAPWTAPQGSNLQQVLRIWSQQAGVDLMWQSNESFTVKNGVNAGGDYESALQSLLNQYTGDRVRPAAQLNTDPVTGRRVLIVEATRV